MDFSHLQRCGELSQSDLEHAVTSREACAALLARMSVIAAPATGVGAIFSVFAALASEACGWLDGDLVIDLVEDDEATTVRVMTDLGGDMREKVFSAFRFAVPLAELEAAVERAPAVLGSLKLRRLSWKRLTLSATEDVRRSTLPPRVGVSDESTWMLDRLAGEQKRAARSEKPRAESSVKPGDIDAGWDD